MQYHTVIPDTFLEDWPSVNRSIVYPTMPLNRLSNRSGMTLIEVLFAVVIMSGVMLALSRFGQAFTRATRDAAALGIASDLATARLEVIRAYPHYDSLSNFAGTEVDTTAYPSLSGYAEYTRTTAVSAARQTKVGARVIMEYKTVTVRVTAPALASAVSKSVDIAKP